MIQNDNFILKTKKNAKKQDPERKIKRFLEKPSIYSTKNQVFYIPRFLQPIKTFRLNIDFFLSFDKSLSYVLLQQDFKKITKTLFNNKYNKFNSLELQVDEYENSYDAPTALLVDRLRSTNDYYAKELAEIFEKNFDSSLPYWDYPNKNEYVQTEEYQEYLNRIEIAKNKRNGTPYFLIYGRYDYKAKGIRVYKEVFSKKLIDILYDCDYQTLYEDFLFTKSNKFPFDLFYLDDFDYEFFWSVLNNMFLGNSKIKIKKMFVNLTRDGTKNTKAELIYKHFPFFDPKNPEKICEIACFSQFKCFEPHLNDVKKKQKSEETIIKIENENEKDLTFIDKINIDFAEKYLH